MNTQKQQKDRQRVEAEAQSWTVTAESSNRSYGIAKKSRWSTKQILNGAEVGNLKSGHGVSA